MVKKVKSFRKEKILMLYLNFDLRNERRENGCYIIVMNYKNVYVDILFCSMRVLLIGLSFIKFFGSIG